MSRCSPERVEELVRRTLLLNGAFSDKEGMCNVWNFFIILSLFCARPAGAGDMLEHCDMASVPSQNNLKDVADFINVGFQQQCLVDPQLLAKNQMDTWALEMMGSDLVRDEIQELQIKPSHAVNIGVFDTDFGEKGHGEKSSQMISGGKFSVGNFAKLSIVDRNVYQLIHDGNERFNEVLGKTDLINFSQYHPFFHNYGNQKDQLGGKPDYDKPILDLLNKKPFVISSGNAGDENGEAHEDKILMRHKNAIVVGAVSDNGLPTDFTNKSDTVTVLAPGDYLRSSDKEYYNGTSASAPIVSGVLSDVMSIAGPIDGDEIKSMLQYTSTPVPIQKLEAGRHGFGVINHYKLFRVAQRLQERKDWPQNKKVLQEPALYNFDQEVETLEKEAIEGFKTFDCKNMRKAIDQLRKAFFLKPTPRSRYLLVTTYGSMLFFGNANFYGAENSQDLFHYAQKPFIFNRTSVNRLLKTHPELLEVSQRLSDNLQKIITSKIEESEYKEDESSEQIEKAQKQVLRVPIQAKGMGFMPKLRLLPPHIKAKTYRYNLKTPEYDQEREEDLKDPKGDPVHQIDLKRPYP